ncbi:MAG TPA: AAA family ATPase [Roseiflexaceae bacterium]|nr:AAA family ATPase [Roseiflexaceae bacterium]HMP43069.1 AAA family ATPase [Roseiflexaceae bacterium]
MIQLRTITLAPGVATDAQAYPFSVAAIQSLAGRSLEFTAPVTFLIGENGSGKSTLLEAIACAARMITVGSADAEVDTTLASVRRLAAQLRLSWARRTRRGFFMRAEDFFGYARRMREIREGLERDLADVDTAFAGSSDLARSLARMPHQRELHEIRRRYGEDLDQASHGESFFTLFNARFVPDGLYLLDEPEAPLSPMRQIGLLARMKELVDQQGAQFLVATHSPILMAYPDALIYSFDDGRIAPIAYADTEHARVTREFLSAPERFLRHI